MQYPVGGVFTAVLSKWPAVIPLGEVDLKIPENLHTREDAGELKYTVALVNKKC